MKNPLVEIPGVGKQIAQDLNDIGIFSVDELKNKDPQKLYDKMCKTQGFKIDLCMLYAMRCAVYYASTKNHNPELLKWWNWKDRNL